MGTPTNAQLELCSSKLKRHTNTQASITDTAQIRWKRCPFRQRCCEAHPFMLVFYFPLISDMQAGSALKMRFEVSFSSAECTMINASPRTQYLLQPLFVCIQKSTYEYVCIKLKCWYYYLLECTAYINRIKTLA